MRSAKELYFINGRFLTQAMTGVQRYATELVRALDRILATDSEVAGERWTLVHPDEAAAFPGDLDIIETARAKPLSGHAWEQSVLPLAARSGRLISLANSGPVLHPRSLVVIHDALVFRRPENYSARYRLLHQTLGRALSRTATLATVSEFSRGEIAAIFGLPKSAIPVIPNGSDHLGTVEADPAVLSRLSLVPGRFFLFVGSPAPHKNLKTALDAWEKVRNEDFKFVVVGAAKGNVFGGGEIDVPPQTVISPRLTDSEIVALYQNAAAFVFPTFYEGFGIPPLEAMAYGCPVLASAIPPVMETCADAARYFDPTSADSIAEALADVMARGRAAAPAKDRMDERLGNFTWEKSARKLLAMARAL